MSRVTGCLQEYAGRSGLVPAFSLIFLSELGDKTFFMAGLLASSVGRWISFTGSVSALSVMTVISVAIGYAFKSVPDVLEGSLPVGKYLAVGTMLWFGVRTLRVRACCGTNCSYMLKGWTVQQGIP